MDDSDDDNRDPEELAREALLEADADGVMPPPPAHTALQVLLLPSAFCAVLHEGTRCTPYACSCSSGNNIILQSAVWCKCTWRPGVVHLDVAVLVCAPLPSAHIAQVVV